MNGANAAIVFARALDAYRKDENEAQSLVEAYETLLTWLEETSSEPMNLARRRQEYSDRSRIAVIDASDSGLIADLRHIAAMRYAKAIDEAVRE